MHFRFRVCTRVSVDNISTPQSVPNAAYGPCDHITYMGGCRRSEIESARARIISNWHPGSRLMICVNRVKGDFRSFSCSSRSYAAGERIFEHREAVPTPLGGRLIAHSLIGPTHLAPCHDIRYTRCLLLQDM